MSHLDEGTLHALLDGELDLSEVSEIQMHLGTCMACGSRLQEVKQVLAEADRLVGAVELPAGGVPRPRAEPPKMAPPPPRPPIREPEAWDETPVLLVPDPLEQARRSRWRRGLKWAAAIVVILGAGRVIRSAFGPSYPTADRDLTSASPAVPPAVVSLEESQKPEPAAAPLRARSSRAAPQNRAPAPTPLAKSRPAAEPRSPDTAVKLADAVTPSGKDSSVAVSQANAVDESADTGATLGAGGAVASDTQAEQAAREDSLVQEAKHSDDASVRAAAAAALAELDRQRRRERANAATAALPPARPVQPESDAVATPRTLEQRAQIYLRVGLDEAARQLGGPVHVIEGMTPQFIGLTRGQLVAGADPARPVVRVVYLDSRGRMILLDQQRTSAGPGPAGAPGSLRWVTGDVMLYLRGEPGPDVLRSLQARVR